MAPLPRPGQTLWKKASNGAFKFKQFPSSALGGERELTEGLQLGTVEAIIVSTGALSGFVPDVGWWTSRSVP